MMATPTPEQLRQRVGVVSLSRFLGLPPTERTFLLTRWKAEAEAKTEAASPMVRLDARDRLKRLDEWAALSADPTPAPASPAAA